MSIITEVQKRVKLEEIKRLFGDEAFGVSEVIKAIKGEKMNYNLEGKIFTSLSNTNNGEVNENTHFYYHQKGSLVKN